MKNLTKKLLIALIILSMCVAFVPNLKNVSEATSTTDTSVFAIGSSGYQGTIGAFNYTASAIPGDVNQDGLVTHVDKRYFGSL